MCGITVSFGKSLSAKLHNQMTKDLIHRGPDSKNILPINKNLLFGHNRLKIIDLSNKANQPMTSNKCNLVFNGIIYNYLELKEELKENFYFKTTSDTEVILAAYLKWKSECFKKFIGMFSIVIWDDRLKKLIVARDRLGIKPLYYKIYKDCIYISSEVKPLLRVTDYKINKNVIYNYFNFSLYEHKENTFFENILQFSPGYVFQIDGNIKIKKKKYWSLFDIVKRSRENNKIKDINIASELVENEVSRIIETYLRSDTKISLLYSSGLDSNALFNLANSKKNKISLLLSFGFLSKKTKDELDYMKKQNVKHFKYRFKLEEYMNNLNKTQIQQEMPWSGPNPYFLGELLNFSKKNKHTVSLSADGSDEIFGGYNKYLPLKNTSRNLDLDYISKAPDNTSPDKESLLKESFFNGIVNENIIECPSNKFLDNARYTDITLSKLPKNFRFSDRYSMNNSVELRYPFLDHKLIELSFKFSDSLFINKHKNKILLRKLYDDKRKKIHINAPQTSWLYEKKFKKFIFKELKNSPIYDYFLERKKVLSYINVFYEKEVNNSFKLWQIINYHLWIKRFFN